MSRVAAAAPEAAPVAAVDLNEDSAAIESILQFLNTHSSVSAQFRKSGWKRSWPSTLFSFPMAPNQ